MEASILLDKRVDSSLEILNRFTWLRGEKSRGIAVKKPGRLIKLLFAAVILCGLYFLLFTVEYHGTVIDADTGQPIEGVIVVAEWVEVQRSWFGIAGRNTRTGKVKETLTDKQGKWSMVGPRGDWAKKLLFFSYLRSPEFIVWKPGYCSYPKSDFLDPCKKMTPRVFGKGETVELPQLTNREDRRRAMPGPIGELEIRKKQKKFIRLINQELKYLGASSGQLFREN